MRITAKEKSGRPGLFEAKGQDPATLKRKSYYGSSAKEAEDKAYASYGIVPELLDVDPESLFGYYSAAYLPTVVGSSKAWQSQIAWAMDGYVLPKFGHRKLNSILRKEWQTFFNGLRMKTSSKRRVKIVVSCIYNLAESDDDDVKNRVRLVRLPKDDKVERIALTFEQLWHLFTHTHERDRPVVILGGFCGLRIGEICAPDRSQFDSTGMFRLRHQIRQNKGGCERTTELKTDQSQRDIPIPQPLLDRLLNCGQVSSIYVTSDTKGGYLTPNNATRELSQAQERAGMGHYEEKTDKKGRTRTVFVPMISPHELRHTFISLMENELEAPPRIVACLAGRAYDGPNAGYSHTHRTQLERWMNRFWERASTSVRQESVVREA